jgi:uncharacterized membrane protein YfcA
MELILGTLIAGVAGFVQGCSGFGFGMIAAPTLALLLRAEPTFITPIVLTLSSANTGFSALFARSALDKRIILPLAAGGLLGMPLGVAILEYVEPGQFRFAMGCIVILTAVAMLSGWRYPLPNALYTLFPVGLSSGVLGGSVAMGGPPVVLFLANQGVPRDTFRASLLLFFFTCSIFGIILLYFRGLYTLDVTKAAAVFIPAVLMGSLLGVRTAGRVPEEAFNKAVILAAGAMGIILLVTSLR